jgi:hypothetical protein
MLRRHLGDQCTAPDGWLFGGARGGPLSESSYGRTRRPPASIACLDQAGDTPARDRLELVLGLVGALAQAGQLPRAPHSCGYGADQSARAQQERQP